MFYRVLGCGIFQGINSSEVKVPGIEPTVDIGLVAWPGGLGA